MTNPDTAEAKIREILESYFKYTIELRPDEDIAAATEQLKGLLVDARIDELKTLQRTHTRTIHQTITGVNGEVYEDDARTYISKYETQERIADLTNQKNKLQQTRQEEMRE